MAWIQFAKSILKLKLSVGSVVRDPERPRFSFPPSAASDIVPILVWLVTITIDTIRRAVCIRAGSDDGTSALNYQQHL